MFRKKLILKKRALNQKKHEKLPSNFCSQAKEEGTEEDEGEKTEEEEGEDSQEKSEDTTTEATR